MHITRFLVPRDVFALKRVSREFADVFGRVSIPAKVILYFSEESRGNGDDLFEVFRVERWLEGNDCLTGTYAGPLNTDYVYTRRYMEDVVFNAIEHPVLDITFVTSRAKDSQEFNFCRNVGIHVNLDSNGHGSFEEFFDSGLVDSLRIVGMSDNLRHELHRLNPTSLTIEFLWIDDPQQIADVFVITADWSRYSGKAVEITGLELIDEDLFPIWAANLPRLQNISIISFDDMASYRSEHSLDWLAELHHSRKLDFSGVSIDKMRIHANQNLKHPRLIAKMLQSFRRISVQQWVLSDLSAILEVPFGWLVPKIKGLLRADIHAHDAHFGPDEDAFKVEARLRAQLPRSFSVGTIFDPFDGPQFFIKRH